MTSLTCVTGCDSNTRCPTGQVCSNTTKTCTSGCSSNTQCPIEQICSSTTQMCVPGCTSDTYCNTGDICVSGLCRAGCRMDSQCTASGTICDATTLVCRAGCRSDATCALNMYCNLTTTTCAAGCDDNNARCPAGKSCVSYTNGTYSCSVEYCESSGTQTCEGSNYDCYFPGGTDSDCRRTCSQTNDTCPTGYRCTLFTDNPSAPDFGNNYYFCAKKCTNAASCTGSVEDVTNPTACQCNSDGACRYGTTTATEECYGDEAGWGL